MIPFNRYRLFSIDTIIRNYFFIYQIKGKWHFYAIWRKGNKNFVRKEIDRKYKIAQKKLSKDDVGAITRNNKFKNKAGGESLLGFVCNAGFAFQTENLARNKINPSTEHSN